MRHWSKTMTIWDRYGSLVKTNSGTTDSQRQFILRSHTQTHTLPLCEIIRLQAEVACVLCGCRCDLVGLCYGLKEPGDTEEASPQRGLLQGLHFPDRLTPASHVLECVLLCPLFISNQFLHPSIPPVLLPPTILPFLSPPLPLHPSVPLRELQILSEAKSILQWEQPSQQRASAAALKLPLQLLYLTSRTHSARTYTPPAFTLWICAACTKHPNIFFFFPSIFTHPNSTRPPLSEVAADVFCREEAYLGENHDPPFQSMRIVSVRSLPFSLHCAGHYNCLVFTQTR